MSTLHLISLLEAQAAALRGEYGAESFVALVLSCGTIVWDIDSDKRVIVDSMLSAGSKPLGLYRVFSNGKTISAQSRMLDQANADVEALARFKTITRSIGDDVLAMLAKCGRLGAVKDFRDKSGTVQ